MAYLLSQTENNIKKIRMAAEEIKKTENQKTENQKTENQEPQAEPEVKPKKKLPSINPKIFKLWLPLYVLQLVAVYFVTVQVLLNKVEGHTPSKSDKPGKINTQVAVNNKSPELGNFIYSIDDMIVNPSDTDGKRLLLASVGFDLKSEEDKQTMKGKEILIKDAIISTLSSKSLDQLSNSAYRDTIKTEIGSRVKKMIPELNLNTVYLSKYIIQ